MKKRISISVVILLLLAAFVWAGTTNFDAVVATPNAADDTYGLRVNNPAGTRQFSVDASGNVYIAGTVTTAITRSVPLPILGFVYGVSNTLVAPLATAPTNACVSFANAVPFISLAYGFTTPVIATFRVPDDYSTGGMFKVFASQSGTATACAIDFDVYVNASGSNVDAAATDQTQVSLAYAGTTPSSITLTPSADFSSLAAGQWVTLRLWRGTTPTSTYDALRINSVAFVYTAAR